jgi:WD40 repeat protein
MARRWDGTRRTAAASHHAKRVKQQNRAFHGASSLTTTTIVVVRQWRRTYYTMKAETPQILWNNQSDSRVPAALYSVSILESGLVSSKPDGSPVKVATDSTKHGTILATAGSTHEVNLWNIAAPTTPPDVGKPIFQRKTNTKINYMCSLSRHERTVNVVRFSPNGLHLATAGDSGTVIVWSVPVSKRGGNNGHHFWSTVTKETELTVRIMAGSGDGVCDIAWSADSKRFVIGTVDHCFVVYEDANYDSNHHRDVTLQATDKPQAESQWKAVFRNTHDHANFIQGVAYDPLGVYLASMSSDRSVKVYTRKTPAKSKKKVLRPSNAPKGPLPPPGHQKMVTDMLTDSKFQLGKAKTIKYRRCALDETGAQVKHHLFADESTMESFFRRLCWTTDGAFLIAPAGLWHTDPLNVQSKVPPAFATLLFARHRFDQPCKVLYGLEKVRLSSWLHFSTTKLYSLICGAGFLFSRSPQLWFVLIPSYSSCLHTH